LCVTKQKDNYFRSVWGGRTENIIFQSLIKKCIIIIIIIIITVSLHYIHKPGICL